MRIDRILLDIETQRDFFLPGGSCYRKNATAALKNIYRLFQWARAGRVPVLSTVLRVRRGEPGPLAPVPHCVEGTGGERKIARTVLPRRINLGLRNSTDLPGDIFDDYQQVIIEKRDTDLLAHARAERLITELPPATFVVCGAGLAVSIFQAAVGLRTRGFGVIAADDALVDLGDAFAPMARLRMEAKGVVFARTEEIVAPKPCRTARPFRTDAIARR